MQSGYGGVSEMQQFMVDGGCPSSLFSISTPPPPPPNAPTSAPTEALHHHHHHHHKFHPLPHPHPHHLHLHQHPPPPTNPPPHFAHFGHPIPITQQLFHHQQQQQQQQQHPHHQFQLFHHHQHQHQLGLDQESGPENSNSSARMMGSSGGSFLAAMNFKLGVNESSTGGAGSRDGLNNEDDGILQGDDGSESRLHSWHTHEDDSATIKEPFWRPLDIDYINPNNKRPAVESKQQAHHEEISSNKLFKKLAKETCSSIDHHQNQSNNNHSNNTTTADSNYKLFSELEAIYKPGTTTSSGGAGGVGGGGGCPTNNNNNNQTGSGSALTGDDNPIQLPAIPTIEHQLDNGSDTSNGGENPSPLKPHKNFQKGSSSSGRRKRAKRRQKKQLNSIAAFFESLVKQLMDHQDNLHQKFLQVMEKRDEERTQREESWRKQEAAKASREATIRSQERALSVSRESAIISFLEKITGETLDLPLALEPQNKGGQDKEKDHNNHNHNHNQNSVDGIEKTQTQNSVEVYNADSGNNMNSSGMSSSRWPKAEVQALIRVRSGLESRFQEPGLKGPLWEEVSATMGSLGYSRSAKRCKEKWENINKYFRKTKDSGKKRPMHSKTCPYFHQLDQLYSKSSSINTNNLITIPNNENKERNINKDVNSNSELLEALIVVSNNNENNQLNFKFGTANAEGEKEEEEEEEEEENGINGEEGEGENSQEEAQDGRENYLDQDQQQLFHELRS